MLSVTTATARRRDGLAAEREGLVPLTCAEIRHLVTAAGRRAADTGFVLAWSYWSRRHQHRARVSHYARRGASMKIK